MEMSSSFWSRVNQFVKVEFRRPLRSRGFIAICRTSVGDSTSYAKRGTAVQADVRFGSLADITTRCVGKYEGSGAVYCLCVRLLREGATDVAALPRGHLLVKT